MDHAILSVEKYRHLFHDYLKKEDNDYVKKRSKKVTIDFYHRKESTDDPWLQCFFFSSSESNTSSKKSPVCFASTEDLKNSQIVKMISNSPGITDEEMNYCKAALRRAAHSRKLKDLSSDHTGLRFLFKDYQEKFPENLKKQRKLYGEFVCNMMNFEVSLKSGLEVLMSLRGITANNTTVDDAIAQTAQLRCIMQDFKTSANVVIDSLCKVVDNFERYKELDEQMDLEIFNFLAHFFPKFLVPRSMRKRGNTST